MNPYTSQGSKIRRFMDSLTHEELQDIEIQVSSKNETVWLPVDHIRAIDKRTGKIVTSTYNNR